MRASGTRRGLSSVSDVFATTFTDNLLGALSKDVFLGGIGGVKLTFNLHPKDVRLVIIISSEHIREENPMEKCLEILESMADIFLLPDEEGRYVRYIKGFMGNPDYLYCGIDLKNIRQLWALKAHIDSYYRAAA